MSDPKPSPLVQVREVSKRFDGVTAVDNVSLDILRGELFAILGSSGCGKTTLLRMLAGFEHPTSGRILIDGADMTDVPPYERPVNLMFQSYALFPHMTVEQNIAYGLKKERVPAPQIRERVAEMLALVKLGPLAARKPDKLSGGEKQRVALARALVKRPKLLLLDEPLAALDKKLREHTQFELANLQYQLGTTFVVVTHDQDEAMTLASRIAVMHEGRIAQVGTPGEVYEYPANRYVAGFVGNINLIEGSVTGSANGRLTLHSDALEADLSVVCDDGSSLDGGCLRRRAAGEDHDQPRGAERRRAQRRQGHRPRPRLLRRPVALPRAHQERRRAPGQRAEPAPLLEADCRMGRRSVPVLGSRQHDPAAHMSESHGGNGEQSLGWLRRAVAFPYFWLLLFFLAPFLIILKISFADPIVAQPPFTALLEWGAEGFEGIRATFSNYAFLFQDGYYGIIYLASLKMAAIGTLLCLLLGYPMAYYIVSQPPNRRNLLLLAVILPFWISFLLRVYAWIGLLNNRGIINEFLLWTGMVDQPIQMLYNDFAVYLGIVYSYLPFMILPLYSNLERLNLDLLDAAADLGARRWRAFVDVTLPLSVPGIIGGCLLVFIPAVGEFTIPALLGGADTLMIGRVLWDEFFINRDWPVASAVSVVLLLLLIAPIMWFQRLQSREQEEAR